MAVDKELLDILACPACDARPAVTLCTLRGDAAKAVVEKYRESLKDEEPVVTQGAARGAFCDRLDIPSCSSRRARRRQEA